ncbi:MAG TPA: histidine kinase [Solirubrobacterales bacterium]|nr:histidine kinase [Solirubrobacterales bacterium]
MNRSSLVLAYALVGAAALALTLIDLALILEAESPWPTWVLICVPWLASSFVWAGIAAALRRPASRMGALMVAAGLVWLLAELSNAEVPALTATGLILATLPLAIVFHLLLAFPSGRLRGRASVVTVLVGYFVCTVMQVPQYLFGGGGEGPWTVLQVKDSSTLADAGLWAQWGVGSLVTVATVVILWQRWRRIAPEGRRAVAPILAYGIFAVLYVAVSGRLYVGIGIPDEWAPWALFSQIVAVAIIPVAFGATMLSGGFGRTLAIDELAGRIEPGEDDSMTAALAATLGDPSVEVALWMPARGAYVDGLGEAVAVPPSDPGRASVEITGAGGERLGALLYDATLAPDAGLAEAAARVVAMQLDRERLEGEVRASAVEARDDERRRLARDLHDGMQTRLLLLAMSANELSEESQLAPGERVKLRKLERELVAAADELRTFAHGFLPPALMERGIYAAAADLADAYPGAIEREIDPGADRPSAPVETTAYFVVSEGLANSLKHADADSVRLSLARENGSLLIEVEDDGRGGARPDGSGIGGIRDRVEALDGTLAVTTPPLGGTLLRVALPCD